MKNDWKWALSSDTRVFLQSTGVGETTWPGPQDVAQPASPSAPLCYSSSSYLLGSHRRDPLSIYLQGMKAEDIVPRGICADAHIPYTISESVWTPRPLHGCGPNIPTLRIKRSWWKLEEFRCFLQKQAGVPASKRTERQPPANPLLSSDPQSIKVQKLPQSKLSTNKIRRI